MAKQIIFKTYEDTTDFHECYLPVEFKGVQGLNQILFPEKKKENGKFTDGFKLPLPEMENEVIEKLNTKIENYFKDDLNSNKELREVIIKLLNDTIVNKKKLSDKTIKYLENISNCDEEIKNKINECLKEKSKDKKEPKDKMNDSLKCEELDEIIKSKLLTDQSEPRVILIKGEPGTGKTLFCAQLMNHFINHFKNQIKEQTENGTGNNERKRDSESKKEENVSDNESFYDYVAKEIKKRIIKENVLENPCIRYILTNDSNGSLLKILENIFHWSEVSQTDLKISSDDPSPEHKSMHEIWKMQDSTAFIDVNNKKDEWYPSLFSTDELYGGIEISENEKKNKYIPKVVFLDSLNLVNSRMSHSALRTFIMECKKKACLTFIIVENYEAKVDETCLQLQSQLNFLADVIIELALDVRHNYTTYSLQVPKMHFGKQTIGKHHYVIVGKEHSTSNIEEERKGLVVYPSIHCYLSHSTKDTFSMQNNFVHTGIDEFDRFLDINNHNIVFDKEIYTYEKRCKALIPNDSMFLLQGDPSMYMIPIGLSLLCGGMFRYWWDGENNKIRPDKDVLIISLSEEGNFDLFNTVLSKSNNECLNERIEWRFHNATIQKSTLAMFHGLSEKDCDENWEIITNNEIIDKTGNVQNDFKEKLENITWSDENIGTKITNILTTAYSGEIHYRCFKKNCFAEDEKDCSKVYKKENEEDKKDCSKVRTEKTENGKKTEENDCGLRDIFTSEKGHSKNENKKVILNKWCAHINYSAEDKTTGKNDKTETTCRKIVIMSFRPGCISPEQFLHLVENILNEGKFSRVLFDSTAMIQSRFPLLATEELFLPALIRLFKSQNLISIFLDPTGDGSDRKLSYGLKNLSDYTIDIGGVDRNKNEDVSKINRRISIDNFRSRNFMNINLDVKVEDVEKLTEEKLTEEKIIITSLKEKGFLSRDIINENGKTFNKILGIPNVNNETLEENELNYLKRKKRQLQYLKFTRQK